MALIETWYNQDLQSPVVVHHLHGNVFSQDNQGNLIGVNVFDGGAPATLSGTVTAYVIRADGATVPVNGVLSGNSCYAILNSSCYAVEGTLSIVIKLAGGGSTTTLCAVVAYVYRSVTSTAVDPGTIIPSIEDLIEAIDEAVASIPLDYSELSQSAIKGNYIWNASKLSTYATADALPVQSCYIGNFSTSDYDNLHLPSRTVYSLDASVFQVQTVGNATFKVQIATYGHNSTAKQFIRMCVSGTWKDWKILSDGQYIENHGFVWNSTALSTYATADALPMQSVFIGNFVGSDYDNLNLPSRTVYALDPSVFLVETVGNSTLAIQIATFGHSDLERQFMRVRLSGVWDNWFLLSENCYVWNSSSISRYATADALPIETKFIGNFVASDYDNLNLPSRTLYKIDTSLFLVETIGNTLFKIQIATYGHSNVAKQFVRTAVSGTWTNWKLIDGESEYVIDKNGNGNNASLVAGIIEAYELGIKNIRILPGAYDMVSEYESLYGSDWETDLLASSYATGLPIGNGMILNFSPDAVVTFDYSEGTNASINELVSAFMAKSGDYEINGLDISCKNIRYCVHDELAGVGSYKHVYANCKMSMIDDANTSWKSCQCIGGGLGKSANIEIRNCIFYSDNNGANANVGAVSYHNGEYADIKSFIAITGCYFDGNNGTIRASWYGISTLITQVIASNNSLKIAPIVRAETAGSSVENVEFIGFNNVIR